MPIYCFWFSYFNSPEAEFHLLNRIGFLILFLRSYEELKYGVNLFEILRKGGANVVEKCFKRKPAAILSADAIEDGQLMGDDEDATAAPSFI